jgi:hypothetical protein
MIEMYIVTLTAHGNIDHDENPYKNIVNGIEIEGKMVKMNTIEECQKAVRNYIMENDLGSGNWTGGKVYKDGKQIGYISYNGRYWEKGSKYYL